MNPNTVFSVSLVTSLVLWFPSMQACLRGDLDLASAGLRYLAALVVSRLAMNGLARLVNAYRVAGLAGALAAEAPHSAAPALGSDPAPTQRRRHEDGRDGGADPASLAA